MIVTDKIKEQAKNCPYCATLREHVMVCPLKDIGDSGETTSQIKMQISSLKRVKKNVRL